MNTVKLFALGVFTATLVGCGAPAPQVVTKPTLVYVSVPAELTAPVIPERPMSVDEYLQLGPVEERERELMRYSAYLMGVVAKVNERLRAIANLQAPAQ